MENDWIEQTFASVIKSFKKKTKGRDFKQN